MVDKIKVETIEKITGQGMRYWTETYINEFYESYLFISDIKNRYGVEGLRHLRLLTESEHYEFVKLLRYLEDNKC